MADPVTTVVAAEAAGDEESDGAGVAVVVEPLLDVPDDESVSVPEVVLPAEVVEWMEVDAAETSSPTPYSFRPTVAPMVTRMTVKRTVPRQDLLLMTCSILLGG